VKRIYANWRLKCGENRRLKLTTVGETEPKLSSTSSSAHSQLLTDVGCRSLRSVDVLTCATKRTQTRLGDESFSVSLVLFKRLLKTLWFV